MTRLRSPRFILAGALLVGTTAGCKGRASSGASKSTARSDADATPTASTDAAPARGLVEGTLTTADDRERHYYAYWPQSAAARPPLLLVLHGGGGTASGAQDTSFTHEAAERHGWFVVYPEGIGKRVLGRTMATWNAGECCGEANKQDVDDVGYLVALLDHLAATYPYDAERVYATGISNGGMMATRLACERPDRFAGFSAVASPGYRCEHAEPVAAQIIHGTEDPCALHAGGTECGGCWERVFTALTTIPLPARQFPCTGAEDQAAFWRRVNGCTGEGKTVTRGDATCTRWDACTSDQPVSLCTIEGGGHTWPGGDLGCDPSRRGCTVYADMVGPISEDLDANDTMVSFFRGEVSG